MLLVVAPVIPSEREAPPSFPANGKKLQERLDEVSKDIKLLEEKLTKIAGGFPVSVPIRKSEDFNDDETARIKQIGWPAKTWVEETLHWRRDVSSQKFRIVYERRHELDHVSAGEWNQYGIQLEPVFKPLIEAPVEIRMRGYEKLPELLDRLSNLGNQ